MLTKKNIIRWIIGIALIVGFIYIAFKNVTLQDLINSLKSADYFLIALLIPLNILGNVIRALRWEDLLYPIKKKLSKRNLFAALMIGYAANNVLPRVGELIRPVFIGKVENISRTTALATVVVERILDLMTFCFMVCMVLFIDSSVLNPFIDNSENIKMFFLIGATIICVLFIILFFKGEQFFRWISKSIKFLPHKYQETINGLLEKFYLGFAVSKNHSKLIKIFLYSFLIWGTYALCMYIPFYAFDSLKTLELSFGSAIVLLVISSISWILPAPGAIGSYHSFLSVAMIKLYGVDDATALSYAILTHAAAYFQASFIGIYYYFAYNVKLSDLNTESEITKS